MKSLLTLAIVLSSATAFATRARVTALGNAAHIVDDATVYSNPTYIFGLSDSLTIESGLTNVSPNGGSTDTGAEALLIRSHGDAKWALSLGHDDSTIFANRSAAVTATPAISATAVAQQNPIELTYGMKMADLSVAGTLIYSNYNDKKADSKESTTGIRLGVGGQVWNATLAVGLVDKWEAAGGNEIKGKSNIAFKGSYWLNSDLYTYAKINNTGYEVTSGNTVTSDVKGLALEVGAINTVKKDGNEFFYGAGIKQSTTKDSKAADEKTTALSVPFIVGVEANATSWLTLRGSVTQDLVISDSKTEDNTGTTAETAPGTNTTAFAAGAGLNFGQLTVDGSILTPTNTIPNTNPNGQKLNATDLLGTVGVTYRF